MQKVHCVLALSVVAAFSAGFPAGSEPVARPAADVTSKAKAQAIAPSPESTSPQAKKIGPGADLKANPELLKKPPQKSWPVTVPEAKDEADAATKPPPTWSAAEIADAKSRCTAILKRIQAVAIAEAPIKDGACGTPAPIQLISIGKNPEVALSPPAIITCEMAEALYSWMKTDVQPLAKQKLGNEVIKIETMSSYACRNAYGRKGGRLSEHGVANALDIRGFVTATGKAAYVLEHWGTPQREILARIAAEKAKAEKLAAEKIAAAKAAEAAQVAAKPNGKKTPQQPTQDEATEETEAAGNSKETIVKGAGGRQDQGAEIATRRTKPVAGAFAISPDHLGGPKTAPKLTTNAKLSDEARREAFMHEVHASACRVFGTTLGPEANSAHRNHFHVDMAQRKSVKICD